MLRGIDPALGPDLLALLRSMGHGDELVIADVNFPAVANARRLVRLDGVDGPRAVRAIASLFPFDEAEPYAAFRMEVSDAPDSVPEICAEYAHILKLAGYDRAVLPIERHVFYARARDAFGIVATGERRLWGNLILKMGAIAPNGS